MPKKSKKKRTNKNDALNLKLFTLVKKNDRDTLELLLKYNINLNVNISDKNGITPLFIAVHNNNYDIVHILLEYNANTDMSNLDGDTPLMIASAFGYIDIVELLLNYSSHENVIKKNNKNKTAIEYAYQNGHTDILELFFSKNIIASPEHFNSNNNINNNYTNKSKYKFSRFLSKTTPFKKPNKEKLDEFYRELPNKNERNNNTDNVYSISGHGSYCNFLTDANIRLPVPENIILVTFSDFGSSTYAEKWNTHLFIYMMKINHFMLRNPLKYWEYLNSDYMFGNKLHLHFSKYKDIVNRGNHANTFAEQKFTSTLAYNVTPPLISTGCITPIGTQNPYLYFDDYNSSSEKVSSEMIKDIYKHDIFVGNDIETIAEQLDNKSIEEVDLVISKKIMEKINDPHKDWSSVLSLNTLVNHIAEKGEPTIIYYRTCRSTMKGYENKVYERRAISQAYENVI